MRQCMVGVPKEVKPGEGRVGITPDGVRALYALGVEVGVEQGAGELSGFSDADYLTAGALTYLDIEALYRHADIIVKVKEPTPEEYKFLPLLKGKVLFTYLHLAGVDPELTHLLLRHEITAIAYEGVELVAEGQRIFPLLVPMSIIAGTQGARQALADHRHEKVVILGGGTVGVAALEEVITQGVCSITLFELNLKRVRALRKLYRPYLPCRLTILGMGSLKRKKGLARLVEADIIISGVLNPSSEAPKVLPVTLLSRLKRGAHIVDVAIDQGGSTDWSRVTHPGESYEEHGLTFSCVPNIPGSTVPREATLALTKVTYPCVESIAKYVAKFDNGIYLALKDRPDLRAGLQTWQGMLTNRAVAEKHNMTGWQYYKSLDSIF